MKVQPYNPATARKLYGILSMPVGNQYAKYNGQLLEVATLLAAGAADLILEKGTFLDRSACFILDREFRLVNEDGNDVSLEAAFGGNFAHGQIITSIPEHVVELALTPLTAEQIIDFPELDEQLEDFSKLIKAGGAVDNSPGWFV